MCAAMSLRRSLSTFVSVFAVTLLSSTAPLIARQAGPALAGLPGDARPAAPEPPEHPALRVSNIRLEPEPDAEAEPSAFLRFNVENYGITQLTDVVLRIAVYTDPDDPALTRAVLKPFTLRTEATLEPGYSVDYEMRLRNLSARCQCVPKVEVVSARAPRE